jgi:hypothetical protein
MRHVTRQLPISSHAIRSRGTCTNLVGFDFAISIALRHIIIVPLNKGSFLAYQDKTAGTDQLLVIFEAIFESWYGGYYRTHICRGSWPRW